MQQQESKIDMRRFLRAIRQCKWVLLAIIVLFTAAGCWIGFRGLPKYDIQGQMLIGEIGYDSDNKGGGIAQMMKTFSVGGFSASTVDNEILILDSYDVMLRTVRTLGLNRTYIGKDREGDKVMLYKDTPVKVEAPVEYFDSLKVSFNLKITLADDGKADIIASEGFFNSTIKEVKAVTLPYMLETCYGSLQIMPTGLLKSSPFRKISVSITSNELAARALHKTLDVEVATKLSDIINVDLSYANSELGKAIVNGVMTEYNAKRLDRLHEASIASIKYYDERIAETFKILQEEEKKVSDYQRDNELMGIDSELELLVGEAVNSKSTIQTANYNIAYYETILDILRNKLDDDVIIPQMESLNDPNIGAFNGAIQARRELRRSATEDNEALRILNEKIEELRNLIIENSTKMIAKARADVHHQQNMAATAQGRLDQYPDYQLEFTNLLRDKEYQNQLYQYLVSQRENSVLQLYSTTNIGFVFQEAYVVKQAGLLKKLLVPAIMFVLAIICCVALTIMIMLYSRKVRDTMDVAFMGIDDNAVKYCGDSEDIRRMRTLITADPARRLLFFAPLGDTASLGQTFADSLKAISRSVELINGLSDNNAVLTPETADRIKTALATNDFVMVTVPTPDDVCDVENLVDADNAALLVTLPAGKIKRKSLKQTLRGQTADKVFTIIDGRK